MRIYLDCVPCFVEQALYAARLATDDEEVQERVVRRVTGRLAGLTWGQTPPYMAWVIHRIIREETGVTDPYALVKEKSLAVALAHLEEADAIVSRAKDPFAVAVRFAVAGNVLDFARSASWDEEHVSEALSDAAEHSLSSCDVDELRQRCDTAAVILYLADNAGEAVFDTLLLAHLPRGRVRYVVKGSPVIDDATRSDAEAAGVGRYAPVIDNGCDAPGTILSECSGSFQRLFNSADVVIAKGQANYETLSDCGRDVFFLTQAKCPVIARDVGTEVGDWLCVLGGKQ